MSITVSIIIKNNKHCWKWHYHNVALLVDTTSPIGFQLAPDLQRKWEQSKSGRNKQLQKESQCFHIELIQIAKRNSIWNFTLVSQWRRQRSVFNTIKRRLLAWVPFFFFSVRRLLKNWKIKQNFIRVTQRTFSKNYTKIYLVACCQHGVKTCGIAVIFNGPLLYLLLVLAHEMSFESQILLNTVALLQLGQRAGSGLDCWKISCCLWIDKHKSKSTSVHG